MSTGQSTGMNRSTGKPITGLDFIWQSINDILTTPIGSRVMRRAYGSRFLELVDQPITAATRLLICAATAGAIARWEKRVRLVRVWISAGGADGRMSLDLTGVRLDLPQQPAFALSFPFGAAQ